MTVKTDGSTVKLPSWFITLLVTVLMAGMAWAVSLERRVTRNEADMATVKDMVKEIHDVVVRR